MSSPYVFIKNVSKTQYSFLTNSGVIYRIAFSEIPDLFSEYPLFANNVYEFIIALDKSFKDFQPAFDDNIGITIAEIVKDFMVDRDKVIVYFCDVKDRKHKARNRKFTSWFTRFNDNFVNYTIQIKDFEVELTYYNTLIVKSENPCKVQIFEAFETIVNGFEDKYSLLMPLRKLSLMVDTNLKASFFFYKFIKNSIVSIPSAKSFNLGTCASPNLKLFEKRVFVETVHWIFSAFLANNFSKCASLS